MTKNYTNEEIEAFKRKDRMHCRQSAVGAVTRMFEGTEKSINDITINDELVRWYDYIYDGILPNQVGIAATPQKQVVDTDPPEPTSEQLKVLSKVSEASGLKLDTVKRAIFTWKNKYPTKIESVDACVKYLKSL